MRRPLILLLLAAGVAAATTGVVWLAVEIDKGLQAAWGER